jgi:hypothetical protein
LARTDLGAVVAGCVGGDDGVVGGDDGVEVGVIGERDLDDPVHALRSVGTDRVDRVGLIERDGVRDGWVDQFEIALARDGSDHRRAAPAGELCDERPDRTEHTLYKDGLSGDGAVSEDGAVGGDAGDPEAGAEFVGHLVSELDGLFGGHDRELRRRAERTVCCAPYTQTRRPTRAESTATPTASTTPDPSLCGTIRG